jgi:tetratricopeptide (TPR) repeat protein
VLKNEFSRQGYGLKRGNEMSKVTASVHYQQGSVLSEIGRFPEALKAYNRAIKLEPIHAKAYQAKGDALRNLEQYEEALQAYNQAIRHDSKSPAPYHAKAEILKHLGREEEVKQAEDEGFDRMLLALETYMNRVNSVKRPYKRR